MSEQFRERPIASRRLFVRLTVLGIAAALGPVLVAGTASARPSDAQVSAAQQAADDAAAQVAQLLVRQGDAQAAVDTAHAQAAAARARYDATQASFQSAQSAAADAQALASQAQDGLAGAHAAVAAFARSSYMAGTTSPGLEAV